jgi:threonyl-tRNA synthetase
MSYEVKSRTKVAEDIGEDEKRFSVDDVLVCFTAIEKDDASKGEALIQQASADVAEVVAAVKATKLLIYPYAHLSSSLAAPSDALKILRSFEMAVSDKIETKRAPFGWYKAFTVSCKGHPLSELSRTVTVQAQEAKKKGEDRYFVLTKDGKIVEPSEYSSGSNCFMAMLRKEALREQVGSSDPPEYLKLCKKFGIEWERMSDVGHEVYHPNAALMFDLSSDYARQVVTGFGLSVFSVKGTNMFNLDEPAVREHAELFGDRLYSLESDDKQYVLRYAACHQQFSMMSGWNISYRQMPVAAFEIADAYRYEQSGETMLLFRLRRLNMPDLHVLCRDMDEAHHWFKNIHNEIYAEIGKLGTDYEMLVNVSSMNAFDSNREFILSLLKERDRDCLIHVYPEGANFYWTVNIEYHILDRIGRAREIGTVQIDTGNARRFNITFADSEGKKKHPIILHTAIVGTIERFMYTVFDQALRRASESGKPGYLPFWFAPEQFRILPIASNHIQRCREIAGMLTALGFRAGIDDRELTISKKVREAKQDWVSCVIVIGDRELSSPVLNVYDRESDTNRQMTLQELSAEAELKSLGYPKKPLYLPSDLSRRVDFSV